MTDRMTIRMVVGLLGAVILLGLSGIIYLIAVHAPAADLAIISSPTTTALGALASVLVSTRSAPDPPVPVEVQNAPKDPVPVTAAELPVPPP